MRKAFNLTVLVAALGYFVDMFDLTIFAVVRMSSLKDLGITDPALITSHGVMLLNLQAFGMLIGGIIWGVLGDKRGRLSVLFGSILMYSLANLLNAFVTDVSQYAALRFIAGIGLAGELGAAVTLVSESMSKENRGYGTTIVATLGLLGAVCASFIGQAVSWRTAYFIGGICGFALLLARIRMAESSLFQQNSHRSNRGDLRLLLNPERFLRYFFCVGVGFPIYFVTGILFTFAPEISLAVGLTGITAGNALLYGSMGLAAGDLASGLASQWLKSRKLATALWMALGVFATLVYFNSASAQTFYLACFFLGLSAGYWAVLVTMAAEQFGTNIRATVATSVPNFVRSSVILMSLIFANLKGPYGTTTSVIALGVGVLSIALFSLYRLRETYGRDLDFVEAADGKSVSSPAGDRVPLGG